MKDGFLLVHQYNVDNASEFHFDQMKSWRWDTAKELLVIRMHEGRVEIPRESIQRVEVRCNTVTDEYIKMLQDFANGGHDGQVHPAGD
jgi:hypothetical protein